MPDPILIGEKPRIVAGNSGGRCGPFAIGGALYGVFCDPSILRLQVWKSDDAGLTWSRIDALGEPEMSTSQPMYAAVQGIETVPRIHVVFCNSSDKFSIAVFDPDTDEWGSALPSTDDVPVALEFLDLAYRDGDGARLVLSSVFTGDFNVGWSRLSGGNAWTAIADLIGTSGDGTDCRSAYWARGIQTPGIDTGVIYAIADRQVTLTEIDTLYSRAISAANTPGTLATINTPFGGNIGGTPQELDEVIIPKVEVFTIGGNVISVFRSTDKITWTTEEVIGNRGHVNALSLCCRLDSDGNPTLFWAEEYTPGVAYFKSTYTTLGGWGDPIELYSDDTTELTGRISALPLTGGQFGLLVNFGNAEVFDETLLPAYFIGPGSVPPSDAALYTIISSNEA